MELRIGRQCTGVVVHVHDEKGCLAGAGAILLVQIPKLGAVLLHPIRPKPEIEADKDLACVEGRSSFPGSDLIHADSAPCGLSGCEMKLKNFRGGKRSC